MPEGPDPNKFHRLTPRGKKVLLAGLAAAFVLVFPPFIYLYYNLAVNRPSQTDREITFEIKKGESISEIADRLADGGSINSGTLFTLYVLLNRLDNNIQAGVYTVKAGMNVKEIVELFQHGKDDVKITFIEGWRTEEFARVASKAFNNVKYEDFVLKTKGLEGYLFPDTYYFNRSVTTDDMINELTKTFSKKTAVLLTDQNLEKAKLTKNEAIVLASIVEREVSIAADRLIVSGILFNRLMKNTPLGADATVQYAVASMKQGCKEETTVCPDDDQATTADWWPKVLTAEDLDFDSPYNTRKYTGLPPAPISSFGLATLEAVLKHSETEYNFYLTDKNGVTHYAKTLEQHNANVRKYLAE